ncbi:MAG: respiratory nitrate reductase subunit gamma [Sporomusaceae bacterium]|nr:respiratory nitrate reductase subunit gamma [Sporomusaceae bacterium]
MLNYFFTGPFMYLAVAVFLSVTIYKIRGYQQMPRHLRWDLYPIPHLGAEGSKYQKVDFHTKAPVFSKADEGKYLGQEMLFIKKAFVNNRKLWVGSWPLHMGIYLGAFWLALLVVGSVMELFGIAVGATATVSLGWAVKQMTIVVGVTGFTAGFIGTLILIWLRYTDEELRYMADFVTYVNLYLMLLVFGTSLAAWFTVDPFFNIIRLHTGALLTFSGSSVSSLPIVFQMMAFGLFLCYLPFSRMMHFAAKYFFYHNIMWDDEAMKPGSKLEADVNSYLKYQLKWEASHISSGGSWVDQVADTKPAEGGSKDEKKD